ncbi:hypothetical protein MCOR25_000936 [Pyricularia grisea]|uniref:Transcription factor CBF/NF-Y/archaeal histone domain-containing protein n=1 Tax=Pyricularia grisea TaxID=148305 RepID=A0A6P8BH90_PYRGI|nr:uncharacterized protein PgNI_01768 [Pyricularia grisea]KAI6382059.1 hypothetical protein MCOR25_000936 [Pyricularia grisea]TLD16143.1 hypothetical protein PgNI_01768 [Pyricularia grisea]
MPYNTTAIPPRRDPTGQTQLPLTRVKKIIAQDQDVQMCSNNAAFIITLAAELFVQHLATEAHNMAKMDRKPRRNIQYKDFANAVAHQESLEFLTDVVPKTVAFKDIKERASHTQARLRGEKPAADAEPPALLPNGKRQKSLLNGDESVISNGFSHGRHSILSEDDPSRQLELEMRQAGGGRDQDQDVDMTG